MDQTEEQIDQRPTLEDPSSSSDASGHISAADFPREVYNDLLCPICLEFFKTPIILPCSHVLCRAPCAEHLFDFNFIRCPVCRENCYVSGGIGSLPRVIALESIIEKYRLQRRKWIQSAAAASGKSKGGGGGGGERSGGRSPWNGCGGCGNDVVVLAGGGGAGGGGGGGGGGGVEEEEGSMNCVGERGTSSAGLDHGGGGAWCEGSTCGSSVDDGGGVNDFTPHSSAALPYPASPATDATTPTPVNRAALASDTSWWLLNSSSVSNVSGLLPSGSSSSRAENIHRDNSHITTTENRRQDILHSTPSSGLYEDVLIPDALIRTSNSVSLNGGGAHMPLRPSSLLASALSASTPRLTLDFFDASVFDVSADSSVTSCPRHGPGASSSLYCHVCQRCVCDVCGDADHSASHETNTLEAASLQAKNSLTHNVDKMVSSQMKVVNALQQQRQSLKDMELVFHRKREEIDMQCDSLLAEVEHKRSLFLADLEQDQRGRHNGMDDVIEVFEKVLGASQSLTHYSAELLEKDASAVLQVSPALNEQ